MDYEHGCITWDEYEKLNAACKALARSKLPLLKTEEWGNLLMTDKRFALCECKYADRLPDGCKIHEFIRATDKTVVMTIYHPSLPVVAEGGMKPWVNDRLEFVSGYGVPSVGKTEVLPIKHQE